MSRRVVIAFFLGCIILGAPYGGLVAQFTNTTSSTRNNADLATFGGQSLGVNFHGRGENPARNPANSASSRSAGTTRPDGRDTLVPALVPPGGPAGADSATPFVNAAQVPACACITQDGIDYLLRDTFTSAQSPLVDGAASEFGMRHVTGSLWEAVDGRLRGGVQTASPTWGSSAVVYGGITRSGGRTLWALVSPQDGEAELFFGWQTAATAGNPTTNGYGFLIEAANIYATEPGAQVPLLTEGKPGHAQQYLMGITLNEGQGAVYWLSTFENQTSTSEWTIPKFPDARIVWASTVGIDSTLYPTVSAYGGFTYAGGHAIEDIRVADIAEWSGADGLATLGDRFTRPDSTSAIGGDWAAPDAGTWGIHSNQAYTSSATVDGRVYMTDGPTDGLMVGDIAVGSSLGDSFGWLVRRADNSNWLKLSNNGSVDIFLETWVNNAFGATILSTSAGWATNTTYRWALGFQDNQYRFWSDGASLNSNTPAIDSSSRDAGATGFGLFGDASDSYQDNWAVYPAIITLPTSPFGSAYGAVPQVYAAGSATNSDTFTDAAGTNLTSHTPDTGGSWSVSSGMWSINARNQLAVESTSDTNMTYVAGSGGDYEASVDLVTPSSLSVGQIRQGLVVRRADANNYVVIRAFMDDASQLDNDEIEVEEFINGSGEVVHKCYLGNLWAANATYTLRAQVLGDVLHVFLNGTPCLTVYLSDSALLTGHGVGLYDEDGTDELLFDNFTLKTIGAVDGTAPGETGTCQVPNL